MLLGLFKKIFGHWLENKALFGHPKRKVLGFKTPKEALLEEVA